MINNSVISKCCQSASLGIVALALAFAFAPLARAAVINTNDSGDGSFREALADAPDGGVITFANALSGQTIYLTSGQLMVTKNLTITASNLPSGIRIDGSGLFSVIHIAPSNNVTLDSLTMTNGFAFGYEPTNSGGGIYVSSGTILTLNNSTLIGSSAALYGGGIYARLATVTLSNSTVSGNYSQEHGGGIYADNSTLTVNESRLADNTALYNGGGLANVNTTLTVSDASISGNSAGSSGVGGGIYAFGTSALSISRSTISGNSAVYGGGIGSSYSTLKLDNSTLAGNAASIGGAILLTDASTLTLNSSTVSGNTAFNSGGISTSGNNIAPTNSIIAGNSAVNHPNLALLPPGSNNLIDVDPLLAPLGNYGGPTQTMPPQPGSPAIGAGMVTTLTNDQRGFARVSGPAPDVGAVEGVFDPAMSFVPIRLPDGNFRFAFGNLGGVHFAVEASTNLAVPLNSWSQLGMATETPPGSGQFQFTDAHATNHSHRFYRVRTQ